ncbi:phosphate acyltransferase PlsX [Catenovulum adriaticum]|uniref:Phosphate acyltransferase n=1 Tax=Catenovulum adriaticum TaxID=2984846 RepID=A0ABY7AN71_9ALTE|nr:phosphate acyltransferase PlsX [Catenovulum sp. TS8]WAJ71013.1 phosphate acyltransferase PlsX [Catenovulum sp. TS8]
MTNLTIALDAMGGDYGPPVTIPAALSVLAENPQLHLLVCGDKYQIQPLLSDIPPSLSQRINIVHCSQVVAMGEKPSVALRNKPASSMRVMLNLVKDEKAQACVSAGNTGALLTMAYRVLKMLPGIKRPALVTAIPNAEGHKTYVLDLGANVVCDEHILHQFALMGSVLTEKSECKNPKVGLLNVGEEEIKGSETIKKAAKLLKEDKSINYIGYVEGNDIFTDKVDVVVCDGLVGNIAMKACEGLAKTVINSIKNVANDSLMSRIFAAIALPMLKKLYRQMNPDQYNGASLLGLRGIVIKSHGNASKDAFQYAIEEAINEIRHQVPQKIGNRIETALTDRS